MSDGSKLGAALARLFPGLPTGPEEDYRAVFDALQCAADVRTLDDYQALDGRPYVTVPAPFQFEDKTWGHKFAPGRYATPDEARAKAAAWAREQMKGTKP